MALNLGRPAPMTESGPRKRRRQTKSCEQCRSRKVRCDHNVPCGPCARARSPLHCSYRDTSLPPLTSDVGQSTSEPYHPAQEEINQTAPNHLTPSSNTSLGDTHSWIQPGKSHGDSILPRGDSALQRGLGIEDIQRQLRSIEERLSSHERRANAPAHCHGLKEALRDLTERVQRIEQQTSIPSDTATPQNDNGMSISAVPPRLHLPGTKMKLLGPTHWIHHIENPHVAHPFNTKDPDPSFQGVKAELASTAKECRGLRQSIKCQQSERLSDPIVDTRSTIPEKSICDDLLYGYMRTFESIYRVIHVPTFWKEYERFWEKPEDCGRPFLFKLLSILSIGTVFYTHRGSFFGNPYLHLAQKWIYAAQSWLTGPSEKSTFNLDGLQVFCLLLIARQACGLGSSPWLSSGSLLRMAMAMGLHWRPANFSSLSVFHSEMRARLWVTVLELTLMSSLDSGTPVLLPEGFGNIAPTNVDDRDISPDSTVTPVSKPEDNPTDTSIQVLLHESLSPRVNAIQLINNRHRQSYQEVLKLGGELRNMCRKVASFFNSNIPCQSIHDLRYTNFHRVFLDVQLRRYILFLYTPFMIQARQEPQFYYARKACLESAVVIASYADKLNLPSSELDDISRLIMVGKGSFKGPLSLDIVSVIGLEIITQLEEISQSLGPASDPLDELTKANRVPLLRKLEHIREQLRQIIAMGTPSMKRYILLSGMLAQICAMESARNVKLDVYASLKKSMKECCSLLEASTGWTQQGPAHTENEADAPSPRNQSDTTFTGFDMHDLDLDIDLSSLLCVPSLAEINDFGFWAGK